MHQCTVTKNIVIVPGARSHLDSLSRFHYRPGRIGAYAALYTMQDRHAAGRKIDQGIVGAIAYTMPAIGLELRNIATGGFFSNLGDRATRLKFINDNIRCIGRVIIDPRYRGLGLAAKLVRETMGLLNVPMIEAMAVMGQINPFFEKAGMHAFKGPLPTRSAQMFEALDMVGIARDDLIDPEFVIGKLGLLDTAQRCWIEHQVDVFLAAYGCSRRPKSGNDKIKLMLSKLGDRPIYYLWQNKTT